MSFKKKYPVQSLINENEDDVFIILDKILGEGKDICLCPDCVLDMAAIALNNLAPRYRVLLIRPVHRDSDLTKARLQKVEEVVRRAVEVVKKKPHH